MKKRTILGLGACICTLLLVGSSCNNKLPGLPPISGPAMYLDLENVPTGKIDATLTCTDLDASPSVELRVINTEEPTKKYHLQIDIEGTSDQKWNSAREFTVSLTSDGVKFAEFQLEVYGMDTKVDHNGKRIKDGHPGVYVPIMRGITPISGIKNHTFKSNLWNSRFQTEGELYLLLI